MPNYDFTTRRLFVDAPLQCGQPVLLGRNQSNRLLNVLRQKPGARILLFNGRDGEWLAELAITQRKNASLTPIKEVRPQPEPCQMTYLFAPLKKGRLDYMVQKAVEMGAGRLQPVITEYTQFSRINMARINASVIEAAEQCGILSLPDCQEPVNLESVLGEWPASTHLIYCDEREDSQNPIAVLQHLKKSPLAVLIGPEGGFSETERRLLRSQPFVTVIPLGPRILRSDTAAVAALAVVQAVLGDWQ